MSHELGDRMSRGTTTFSVGVAILVGIVALVGASFFATGQANDARGFATQLDQATSKKVDARFGAVEKSVADGDFGNVTGQTGTFDSLYAGRGLDATGAVNFNGDETVVGMLSVYPDGLDKDAALEVVSGGVNVAQLTSFGGIGNDNGSFAVDANGQLVAASGAFNGQLDAKSAVFDIMNVNSGKYEYSLSSGGWVVRYGGGTEGGAGFALGDPTGGNDVLRALKSPYFYAYTVAVQDLISLTGSGFTLTGAVADPKFGIGYLPVGSPSKIAGAIDRTSDWALIGGEDLFGAGKDGAQVNGTLNVVGNAIISGDIGAATAHFGALTATELATLKDGAEVTGELKTDTLKTTGDATIGRDLATTGDATIGRDLATTGDATINGALKVSTIKSASSGGLVLLDDSAKIEGDLAVVGDTTMAVAVIDTATIGSLDTTGMATLKAGADVTGGLTSDEATVTGTFYAENASFKVAKATNVTVTGTLTVSAVSSDTTVTINAPMNVTKDLDVGQKISAADGNVTGALTAGTLTAGTVTATALNATTLNATTLQADTLRLQRSGVDYIVATGGLGLSSNGDDTPEFAITSGGDATLASTGKLTVYNLSVLNNVEVAGVMTANGGIDKGTGNWAGTATVANGNTTVGVPVGFVPSSVTLTPESDLAGITWWLDRTSPADGFTINLSADPGADVTFSYTAIR